jgi:hypothetical protein
VIERILQDAPRAPELADKMRSGDGLDSPDQRRVYRPEQEQGPGGPIDTVLITPHAEYRMDLRGVTVPEVRLGLRNFLKQLRDWKSQKAWEYDHVSKLFERADNYKWTDPQTGLVVVFAPEHSVNMDMKPLDMGRVVVITTYWEGVPDTDRVAQLQGQTWEMDPPPEPNRDDHPFVGTIRFRGLVVYVENAAGDVRTGIDPNGEPWETTMLLPYGEIKRSEGADGDALDVYVGPDEGADTVYVVHQNDPETGEYDEDKVFLGVASSDEVTRLYLAHYDDPRFLRSITSMSWETFIDLIHGEAKGEKLARQVAGALGSTLDPVVLRAVCRAFGVPVWELFKHHRRLTASSFMQLTVSEAKQALRNYGAPRLDHNDQSYVYRSADFWDGAARIREEKHTGTKAVHYVATHYQAGDWHWDRKTFDSVREAVDYLNDNRESTQTAWDEALGYTARRTAAPGLMEQLELDVREAFAALGGEASFVGMSLGEFVRGMTGYGAPIKNLGGGRLRLEARRADAYESLHGDEASGFDAATEEGQEIVTFADLELDAGTGQIDAPLDDNLYTDGLGTWADQSVQRSPL